MADKPIGTSVARLSTADALADKRAELETLRTNHTQDWALNRAFYKGDQWVFWNRVNNRVESLPVRDGDKSRWKVRLTSDQIKPGVLHYVAQLTKTRPTITATPDSSSYKDVCAAQVGNDLHEYWWRELLLRTKLNTALVNATLDQGWWAITWDGLAGKPMEFVLDPNGSPITDDELADVFMDQLEDTAKQNGLDPKQFTQQFKKTVYVGEIDICPLAGQNVLIDPSHFDYEKAMYAICKHPMDVDEIYSRWKVRIEPDSAPEAGATPLIMQQRSDQRPKTVRDVYIGYFRPSPVLPKGRYVAWVEGPNQILQDDPWPYPFNDLPLVKFPGLERPGSALDEPLVTMVRPLQKELNRTLSQIVQHKDLTIKPQMIAPVGSLRQKLTDEPGAVFEYQPIQGLMPEWRPTPQMPASGFQILADIQQRIDRAFNRIPSQRDSLPARVDAGNSIELIQEAVADQLSPIIAKIEEGLARAGKLMILLAKEYYTEPRLLKIQGSNGSTRVRKFMNSDLSGSFSFHAEAGSGLPRSRAARQTRILELVDKNLLSPQQALKDLDLADMKSVAAKFEADEDHAYREHEILITGQTLNPLAVNAAMQQVQQAMSDPNADVDQDGQPDTPQEKQAWAQQQLQQAALAPTDFEDWDTHVEIHSQFMKSPEFSKLPEDAQQRFLDHYNATYQRVIDVKRASLTLDPKVAPKTTFAIRGTASPPVASKLLERSGVDASEDEVAEPPLETAIYDSMDKPDEDDAANDPLSQEEKMLEMQQAEDAHELSQAQTHQAMTQGAEQHAMGLIQTQQQMRQKQEQSDAAIQAKKQGAANGGTK